jgi:hypothetical protein
LRLYEALEDSDRECAEACRETAHSQYVWFSSWFAPSYEYLRIVPGGGLVEERPHHPKDYCNTGHPNWQPGWTWTGDQGLILGALAETRQIKDAIGIDPAVVEENVTQWIGTIVKGIRALLVGSDNVLREAPFQSAFSADLGGDPKDYVCGRGVLMRYLAEDSIRGFLGGGLDEAITATATAVWDSRDPASNQFGAEWNPAGDRAFNESFAKRWGKGDTDVSWSGFGDAPREVVNPILQALGLDVIGAAIRGSARPALCTTAQAG